MNKYEHGGRIYDKQVHLDFSSNINPFGMPEGVKQAICNGVTNYHLYPDDDVLELSRVLANHEHIDSQYIICGNGASDLIYRFCYSLKPKRACVLAPTFSEYEKALMAVDCQVDYIQLQEEHQFCLEQKMLGKLSKEYDVFFLCNPNNPVGNLIMPHLMEQILDVCCKNQIFLVIDECFLDFIEEHETYSAKRFIENPEYGNQVFILKAFTKLYGMAGIRLGYGICRKIDLLSSMKFNGPAWNVSTVAQLAGIAALKETEYVERTRKTIIQERNYLMENLIALGILVYPSKVNYIFFKAPVGLAQYALTKGILIRSCANYMGLNEQYYRIAVRLRKENEALITCIHNFYSDFEKDKKR